MICKLHIFMVILLIIKNKDIVKLHILIICLYKVILKMIYYKVMGVFLYLII